MSASSQHILYTEYLHGDLPLFIGMIDVVARRTIDLSSRDKQTVHKKGTREGRISGAHLLRGKIVKVPGKRHVTAIRATGAAYATKDDQFVFRGAGKLNRRRGPPTRRKTRVQKVRFFLLSPPPSPASSSCTSTSA